jgi:hypothetical protein
MKRAIFALCGTLLCCGIFVTGARAQNQPACCSITAIDVRTGNISAKVSASGQTFQFRVNDTQLLPSLRVGQGVYANLGAKEVSLDGKSIAGPIVSISAPPLERVPLTRVPVLIPPKGTGGSSGPSGSGTAGSGSSGGSAPANSGNANPTSGSSTTASSTCGPGCNFEQDQRANSMSLQGGVDAVCLRNAFGGKAITMLSINQMNSVMATEIKSGVISLLFAMPGIGDLSGTNDPSFKLGVLWGGPVQAPSGTVYDGSKDLDWWYTPNPQAVGANRVPLFELNASMVNGALVAGPGVALLPFDVGGVVGLLRMSNATIHATVGATSVPLVSTNQGPPGHLQAEKIKPTLSSFNSMVNCAICGSISAASLAAMPVSQTMQVGGQEACAQGYTALNSLLDVIVGGCSLLVGGEIPIVSVNPTQPDTIDTTAAPGQTTVYRLTSGPMHHVTCGGTDLATCLKADAYSAYFKFTTDRVIIK